MHKTLRLLFTNLFLVFVSTVHAMDPSMGIDLTVKPPIAEDFIPEIKVALPKHLEFKSVKITDVKEMAKGPMVMYQCQLEITATTKDALYSMKEFKDGKYHIKEVNPKGTETKVFAMSILGPSARDLPMMRVVLLPKNPNDKDATLTGTPLSKYREGTYIIVK